jgi:hypothetical protein
MTALMLAAACLLAQDLPGKGPVVRVAADGKGRTWVGEEPFMALDDGAGADREAVPRHDLAKAYEDPSRALRFGRLMLVDSTGRIWLRVGDARLWAYDGKGWSERRTSDRAKDAPAVRFLDGAVETAGALWFPDELGVHRLAGAEWSYHAVFDAPAEARLVVDGEGRPWIWSASRVRRWDGSAFVEVKRLAGVVRGVFPAGRAVVIVLEDGVFAWPADEGREPAAKPAVADLPRHIENLTAVDQVTRDEAEHLIVATGKDAVPVLKEAAAAASKESLKKKLERLAAEIESGRSRRARVGDFCFTSMIPLWGNRAAAYVCGSRRADGGTEWVALRIDGKGIARLASCEEGIAEMLATTDTGFSWHADGDGVVWASRWKTGLWRFDGEKMERVPGASSEGSYEYLGTDAGGAQWWRQVYVARKLLRVGGGKAGVVAGR